MNATGYILSRIALSFGIHRKNKRLSEAADEMHLLRQAEEILGEDVWEQVEEVEEVSVEYWSLRKLMMRREELKRSNSEADKVLNTSHEERSRLLDDTNQACLVLDKKREELIRHSEQLVSERDNIVSRAKLIKRKFDASKTKIAVLSQEGDASSIIASESEKLSEYKVEFLTLKQARSEIAEKINRIDHKITQIEDTIAIERKKLRDQASHAYQNIGKANRDVSKLTAEIGLIDVEAKDYYTDIGRYVSTHAGTDAVCTKICRDRAHLIAQMQSLRASIAFNHKLASLADNS
ncbi:MAG: hypothetical protein ACPG32_00910 [Akkermansiaceae bacterium]